MGRRAQSQTRSALAATQGRQCDDRNGGGRQLGKKCFSRIQSAHKKVGRVGVFQKAGINQSGFEAVNEISQNGTMISARLRSRQIDMRAANDRRSTAQMLRNGFREKTQR
jgi:hypothetical protein